MMDPSTFKLPKRLSLEPNRTIIDSFHAWERTVKKSATFRNHLHFTLHCKHHNVTTPSLKLKSGMKGRNVDEILKRAQRALVNERINETKRKLEKFKSIISDSDEFLFTELPSDLYSDTKQWMESLYNKTFDHIRSKHQSKFQRLFTKTQADNLKKNGPISLVTEEDSESIKSKWVINLSDKQLTPDETSVLRKGLNFAVTPNKIPFNDYIIGIESACRSIGPDTKEAETLRADCVRILKNSPTPQPNLPKVERTALSNLAKDKDITIVPADKGRSVVILNTVDYKSKARAILSDTQTYQILEKDPTAKFSKRLVDKLQECKKNRNLDDSFYRRLYPTSATIPRFYGLPKVHKKDAPLRPIVASRGSITYDVAQHLALILSPLVGQNEYALQNSAAMVKDLGETTLEDTDVLVSFDVTALFTKVPIDKSLEIIYNKLVSDEDLSTRTTLTPTQIRDLLEICLKTTYFQFDNVIYTQVEGAAMGSPVSPIVANLFMEWFEEHALQTFPYEVTFWRRYVDDTIVALCDSLVEPLTTHINSIDPSIKFTREEENEDHALPMLDTVTTRDAQGNLSFTVYRKPTHTDQYLQFSSNQPLQHKLGVIRTLYHRCQTICSNEELKLAELDHLKKVLTVSGYTKAAWHTATTPRPQRQETPHSNPRPKSSITLPYVGPVTQAIARNIRKAGVAVHTKPFNTIRSRLVHPKDKIDTLDQAGAVYQIGCDDCEVIYIGESERKMRVRYKEHHRSSSPVGHHLDFNEHKITEDSMTIIHKESDWFKRGVAEAIEIERHSPILNRDKGRHILPKIYQEILPPAPPRAPPAPPLAPPMVLSRDADLPDHVTDPHENQYN